jgi:hypothetical protein
MTSDKRSRRQLTLSAYHGIVSYVDVLHKPGVCAYSGRASDPTVDRHECL